MPVNRVNHQPHLNDCKSFRVNYQLKAAIQNGGKTDLFITAYGVCVVFEYIQFYVLTAKPLYTLVHQQLHKDGTQAFTAPGIIYQQTAQTRNVIVLGNDLAKGKGFIVGRTG